MLGAPAASRADRAQLAVTLGAVVVGVVVRLASVGVLAVGPDDAEYIGVGRRLWALHAPSGIDGSLYTIRSWVWPLVIGAASHLGPGDPFAGPRVLGVALGLVAVTSAVGLGYRLARGRGALGVAAALLVTSAVWEVVASTRVDIALLAAIMVTLTVAARPSPGRALAAGLLAGVTLLVKETSAPLVLLPLAWLGAVPRSAWRPLVVRFLAAFAAVVAWWFVVVLVARGEIFPLQGVAEADRLAVPRPWSPDGAARLIVLAWLVGTVALVVWRRRDVAVRVVLVGFAAMVPASWVAWHQELALRQFVPLAALGAVIAGVGLTELAVRVLDRVPTPRRARVALVVGLVVAAALVVPLVRVQTVSDPAVIAPLDGTIASWLGDVSSGGRVVSTFRYQAQVWARVGERIGVERLTFANPARVARPGRMVWIDWRLGAFHTLSRAELRRTTRGADALIVSGPHRLGPSALARWLDGRGANVGVIPRRHADRTDPAGWARLYALRRPDIAALPTLVTTTALARMTDAEVGRLPDVVVAGPSDRLAAGAARVADLTGVAPATLVSPL